MKTINKLKIIFMTVVLMIMTIVACKEDFLDVRPTGSLTEVELTTAPGLEGSLIATYSYLLGRNGQFYNDASNWYWGSVRGGDANKGSNTGDQAQVNEIQTYSAQVNNSSIQEKYQATYEGVARANITLGLVANAQENVPEDVKTRVAAEARFLRAHYYFDLKRNFGDTPYVDENWEGDATPVPNDKDLYQFIEADLQFAFDNLPETQGDAGRANKWAAGAYLGKVLVFQGKYDQAKTILDQVISDGVTAKGDKYALLDDYRDNFRSINDNNPESVFSVQAAAGTGDINNANPNMVLNFPHGNAGIVQRPGECCGFFQPSFELVNSYRTDDNGLPMLDGSYNDAGNEVKNDMGIQSGTDFTPDDGNLDPRLDHSVGRRGIPYLDWGPHPGYDWIRDQPYGGPYSPKKFSYYKEGIGTENDGSSWTPGYTAVNYDIIRYADVLLLAAEAEINASGGSLDQARTYINMVRERASNSVIMGKVNTINFSGIDFEDIDIDTDQPAATYNVGLYPAFADKDEAMQALMMERKLELAMEGHRMYDLVRWDEAGFINIEEYINGYLSYEDDQHSTSPYAGATFKAKNDELLPIPQSEIDQQGEDIIKQNPGY